MATQAKGPDKNRSAVIASLVLGAVLASIVAMGGTARQADAVFAEKVVFVSDRTTGVGVKNPTADKEIYRLNASDGLGKKNLTNNATFDEIYFD